MKATLYVNAESAEDAVIYVEQMLDNAHGADRDQAYRARTGRWHVPALEALALEDRHEEPNWKRVVGRAVEAAG